MLKKSKGNRFHQQGFIFSTFPINFIICLTPYRKASITGAFFIKESEDDMGVRVVFPDMGKDPSIQLIEKTITENGTYDALTDGANGYSKVNVNVEGGGGESDLNNPIQLELAKDGNTLVTVLTAGDIYALCQTGTPYFTLTAEQVATYHNLYKPNTKYFINEYFHESTDGRELVGLRFVMLGIADTTDEEVKTMYDTTRDPDVSTDHLIIAGR